MTEDLYAIQIKKEEMDSGMVSLIVLSKTKAMNGKAFYVIYKKTTVEGLSITDYEEIKLESDISANKLEGLFPKGEEETIENFEPGDIISCTPMKSVKRSLWKKTNNWLDNVTDKKWTLVHK